jgi:hypothetical protein
VEHPCAQCHSAVPDDAAFCANCGAAQIRFGGRESAPQPALIKEIAIPEATIPPELATYIAPPTTRSHASVAIRSALQAGAIAAVLSFVPIRPTFILALPLGGFLAILLYRRRILTEPPPALGFRLGSLTGFFGFVTFVVLTAVQVAAFHAQNELRDTMLAAIRQARARSGDPQAQQMLEYFMTPQGLIFMMAFGLVFMGIVFVLLGGLGGAVSASLLRRKPPDS